MIVNRFPMFAGGAKGIYGASWDGTSTTKWTRTDDSALFSDPVPAIGTGSGSSPFDNIMPWAGMVRETIDDNEMVKIPKYWFKWSRSGSRMTLQLANYAADGFHTAPAHADRNDGNGERDYVYVGRYHCTSGYKSKSGGTALGTSARTRAQYRDGIRNTLGGCYYMFDFAMWWTIGMLYLVEFADWNSQETIGYGIGPNYTPYNGKTDSMKYHTGTISSARNVYGPGVQYRNIENLWAGVYDYVDGISYNYNTDAIYVYKNPSYYNDNNETSGGTIIFDDGGKQHIGMIKGFTNPTKSGLEWALYPNSFVTKNIDDDTYVSDRFMFNYAPDGVKLFAIGGTYYSDYGTKDAGLFYLHTREYINSIGYGTRLQYLP